MSALVILICASLFIAILFLAAFVWATKKGQYDDSYTPSIRILFDEFEEKKEVEGSIEILKQVQNDYQSEILKQVQNDNKQNS
jgi:cbb3-type cytochrome oxidase maturation protein